MVLRELVLRPFLSEISFHSIDNSSKKLARPFYIQREKTQLQTLNWSLSIGSVKLGLDRRKFVYFCQILMNIHENHLTIDQSLS